MYALVKQWFGEAITSRISARTLQQGVVMVAANMLGNVLQYLFHFASSRMLGPADYGVVTTLLGLGAILTVPTSIAQMVITQYVSGFYARNELGKASSLFADAMKKLSLAGFAAFILLIVANPLMTTFLNLPSLAPVIAMASVILFMGQFTVIFGTLQGLQRFTIIAAQSVLGPGFRLVVGVLLIALGMGASGALGATTISNLLMIGIGAFFLRDLMRMKNGEHGLTLGAISQFTGIAFLGMLAFSVLTNIDLLVVKHYFSPLETGYYSAASVLGKIILFFPGAIAILMFPKTSYRYALGQNASDIGRKSVLVTAVLCGVAVAVLAIFPGLAVHVLFGGEYEPSIALVGLYGVTMALFALVQVLLMFYISQEKAGFAWILVFVTAALAIFLTFVHVTLTQVIVALAVSAVIILIAGELWLDGLGLVRSFRTAFK